MFYLFKSFNILYILKISSFACFELQSIISRFFFICFLISFRFSFATSFSSNVIFLSTGHFSKDISLNEDNMIVKKQKILDKYEKMYKEFALKLEIDDIER